MVNILYNTHYTRNITEITQKAERCSAFCELKIQYSDFIFVVMNLF